MNYAFLLNPEKDGPGAILTHALGMDSEYGVPNLPPSVYPLHFNDFEEAGAAARDILKNHPLVTIAIFGFGDFSSTPVTWEGKLCVEAHVASRQFYVPCGNPATTIVKTRDAAAYAMCKFCADHNFSNRGAVILVKKGEDEK